MPRKTPLDRLTDMATKFDEVRRAAREFGACDSEPLWAATAAFERTRTKQRVVVPEGDDWELYEIAGATRAARSLTAAFRRLMAAYLAVPLKDEAAARYIMARILP